MLISLPFLLQVFCFLTLEALCALEARAQVGLVKIPSGGIPLPSLHCPIIASLRCLCACFCVHFVRLTVATCSSKLCTCAHNLIDVSYPSLIAMLVLQIWGTYCPRQVSDWKGLCYSSNLCTVHSSLVESSHKLVVATSSSLILILLCSGTRQVPTLKYPAYC